MWANKNRWTAVDIGDTGETSITSKRRREILLCERVNLLLTVVVKV